MKVDDIIQLWVDAEDALREGNDSKCVKLKDEFSSEFSTLSGEDQKEVSEYLESIGA